MNKEGKKCVLYVRVSTEMQVDGYSLDAQKNMLKNYAQREGMEIINIYEDAGKSGKSIEGRPAFQKMMLDITNGLAVDYILVYKLSRFGRNAADILNSLELIQSYDINLISVNEGIDSSQAMGKVFISLLSAMSELERENILEQTMNGRREKARQGGWNGGFAPYGYKLEDGKLLIAEDEVDVIREIFKMYAIDNMGCDKIAKELNLRGIKKKIRQNNTLEIWAVTTVRRIIGNPVYIGKIAYGRRGREKIKGTKNQYKSVYKSDYILEDGHHEPIISEELWNKAQEKLKSFTRSESITGSTRVHYLSGILKCPKCGSPMYASKYFNKNKNGIYKEYFFYECSRHKSQRGMPCDCNLKIRKPMIEPYLVELIKKQVNNAYFINKVSEYVESKTDNGNLEKEKEQYEAKLKEVLDNKARVEFELDNMPLDIKHRERRINDLNSRLDELYDIMDDLETRINDITVKMASIELGQVTNDKVMAAIQSFDNLYDVMNDEEKKKAITGIVKEIHVNEEPAVNNNYIKDVVLNFNLSKNEAFEVTVSGEELNQLPDLSYDYIENTYLEMETDREYKKNTKSYYVPKHNYKLTYKMVQDYVMEHYGFKVHSTYIAEIKRKVGLDMQADRHNRKHKYECPKEKADAIEEALRYYKVI